MDVTQTIVLALTQGLTEFLPISSSAHLVLVSQVFEWPDQGLQFDVAVHFGSLIAVVLYLRNELSLLSNRLVLACRNRETNDEVKLLLAIGLATIPIAVVGLVGRDFVEANLRSSTVIAVATLVFGIVLWLCDRFGKESNSEQLLPTVTYWQAVMIGSAQVLALVPGTSRAGITISAALLLGLGRIQSARFAFLLAIPAILGSSILLGIEAMTEPSAVSWDLMLAGVAFSGLSAYAAMNVFVRFVNAIGLAPFAIYRILLGVAILILL